MNDEARTRLALAALAFGASSMSAYGAIRGWVYLRGGARGAVLLLRQQTTAYYHVLGVAAFVGLSFALATFALVNLPADAERFERLLGRALLPLVLLVTLADFLFP